MAALWGAPHPPPRECQRAGTKVRGRRATAWDTGRHLPIGGNCWGWRPEQGPCRSGGRALSEGSLGGC